jgi:DNA processing protein
MELTHSNAEFAAIVLAALEVAPGEPTDVTRLLRDERARSILARLGADDPGDEFLGWLCSEIEVSRVETWTKRLHRLRADLGDDDVARRVATSADSGTTSVAVLLPYEDDYPKQLAACWDAPPLLFIRGTLAPERRSIAIVGSRCADAEAVAAAEAIARAGVRAGMSVVSGLAAGVDAAAHRAALAAGGHTVAVMGTGIRRVFPAEHAELAREIAQRGALLSQFAPDAPRTGTTFLRRNSVIAGLSDVDFVVAGTERSGSRHQAEQAVRYGRRLLFWAPALGNQPWASAMVEADVASFVDDLDRIELQLGT